MDDSIELLLNNRRFLYAFASRAFASEPDGSLLSIAADEHTGDEFSLVDGAEGANRDAWQAVAEAAAYGETLLRSEFARLFIGPESLPAPPWESVYVTGEPLLFQESTLKVREAYLEAGFRAAGYPREADDHIATELSLVSVLACQNVEAYAAGEDDRVRVLLEVQQRFLRDHLLAWVGEFSDRLREAAPLVGVSCFYPSLARLTVLMCERDAEVIEELLAA